MPEGLPTFVRVTFNKNVPGETDEQLQVLCEGSLGTCIPNVLGVFRFPDSEGLMAKHVEYLKGRKKTHDSLSERIEKSPIPRPLLRLRRWWIARELASIRAKEMLLVRRQMCSSDLLFEEVRNTLRPYTYNDALGARLDELLDATGVKIEMRQGRLTEPTLDYVV